jgi:ubiquinone/menaquinone biosynthesis C-methylase UbiE
MSMRSHLVKQFRQPEGLLGALAGTIMARRPSNVARNQWTIDLLDLKSDDRVLEIGFGPGLAIEAASLEVTEGMVIGIDHSQVMLRQASKRNADAIAAGRVELYLGSLENLPPYEQPFTKIYSANVVQFWNEPIEEFRKLRSMLARGGLLASTYMPRNKDASNENGRAKAEEIKKQLLQVGFTAVHIRELSMQPLNAYSVLASHE